MKVQARTAKVDDLSGILSLERECFAVPWSEKSLLYDLEKNNLAHYFVAISDEKIVGYVGMWLVFEEAQITNLAVTREYRKIGVATLLLNELINYAKTHAACNISLEVSQENIPAIMFYEKHGFSPVAIRENYYGKHGGDAIIMFKEI